MKIIFHRGLYFILISVLVAVFCLRPIVIYAESSAELQSIFRDTPFYDPTSDVCSVTSSDMSVDDRHRFVWDYLTNRKHLSANAAAGIMGNLEAISEINPHKMQGGTSKPEESELPTEKDSATNQVKPLAAIYGLYGYGIVQWKSKVRQLGLLHKSFGTTESPFNIARSTGDLEYQLDYMWSELESDDFIDILSLLRSPDTTLNEASDEFLLYYDAPATVVYEPLSSANGTATGETYDKHLEDKEVVIKARQELGAKMLQLYQSTTYTRPAENCEQSQSTGGAVAGDGKVDSLTGYAFPLEPQTRAVGGITINQLYSRHGGKGPAFDLFGLNGRKGGDDIYAFDDGEVAGVGEDEPGWCYNIQLKAADGFYYWYGHLNNVVVKRGDNVRAGQAMGEIAEWTPEHNCDGSSGAAHLHIDRGCTINGVPQTGGRDECRDPAFIPLLSEIYGRL